MTLLSIVLVLVAVGVLLFAINRYGSKVIDPKMLKLINVATVVLTVFWLLRISGVLAWLLDALSTVHV